MVLTHYITPCVLLFIPCSIIEATTDDVIKTQDFHSEVVLLHPDTTEQTSSITLTLINVS